MHSFPEIETWSKLFIEHFYTHLFLLSDESTLYFCFAPLWSWAVVDVHQYSGLDSGPIKANRKQVSEQGGLQGSSGVVMTGEEVGVVRHVTGFGVKGVIPV